MYMHPITSITHNFQIFNPNNNIYYGRLLHIYLNYSFENFHMQNEWNQGL